MHTSMESLSKDDANEGNLKSDGKHVVSNTVNDLLTSSSKINDKEGQPKVRRSTTRMLDIKYQGQQVIKREGISEPVDVIPIGTNLIGRLLTSVDTRESDQLYKVLLPYGGKHKGGGRIAKNAMLFGRIKYPGKGKKVFITFEKGVLPDGNEFKIHAQALNTKDYSPGIIGEFHGKAGLRIASTLGLKMVSGMTEVLTEKQELGKEGAITPKSTMKNALYHGVSQVSQVEATRQASELSQDPEYVTIDAGIDLIVNLTASYKEK